MPTKKKPASKRAAAAQVDVNLRAAVASGRSAAEEVIALRTKQVPDGRGFLGGWWQLPGPWLKPGFQKKGHDSLATNTMLIGQLIDRFNAMLATVSSIPEFAHVQYLDLRGTLKRDGTYKKDWANELHPSQTGFALVTKKFADAIEQL